MIRAREVNASLRVVGVGHSPNASCLTSGWMVSLRKLNRVLSIDTSAMTVKVQAGATLDELHKELAAKGLQMLTLPSILEQTIGGAIGMATHSTGLGYKNLSSSVTCLELMTAQGDIIACSATHNSTVFDAARCSAGLLGIILTVTLPIEIQTQFCLRCVPERYEMVRRTYATKVRECEHYKFFWVPHTDYCYESFCNRVSTKEAINPTPAPPPPGFFKRLLHYHLFEFLLFLALFVKSLIPLINRFYAYLNFSKETRIICDLRRAFTFDCLFPQYVSEYAIPVDKCFIALDAIAGAIEKENFKVHFPIEIRFVANDNVWMSPAYRRDVCYIGIIMYRPYGWDSSQTLPYLNAAENALHNTLGAENVRTHLAKYFQKDLKLSYPKLSEFVALRDSLDPLGMLHNKWSRKAFSL